MNSILSLEANRKWDIEELKCYKWRNRRLVTQNLEVVVFLQSLANQHIAKVEWGKCYHQQLRQRKDKSRTVFLK